jgi:hypothetical protein
MRALAHHRPDQALRRFRAVVASCPAERPEALSHYLYWLAQSLLKLDQPELALKSLASAQKLRPRGHARAVYLQRINDYGMCRRASAELDDFYAFYSLQACAYLGSKPDRRFDSNTEKDAVTRLIADAWRVLVGTGKLKKLTVAKKLKLFKAYTLAFPLFGLSQGRRCKTIAVDFRRNLALKGDERCLCGSGLPYIRCCGRTASPRESFFE